MIATELLCHGDQKVQVGVLQRNHLGEGCGVLSHVALLNCQAVHLSDPRMASALDHKRYLWCVHTRVRRGAGNYIITSYL